MKVLIIEDEEPAYKRLKSLLEDVCGEDLEILASIDSVSTAVKFLKRLNKPDLIFMDIQLADGLSFEIFREVDLDIPIIFTTAFNQYAIKAFKVNSVDYLLKPVDREELEKAIAKFRKQSPQSRLDPQTVKELVGSLHRSPYKDRFLVKHGQQLEFVPSDEIAYCYSEDSLMHIVSKVGKTYMYDKILDETAELLDPSRFFRVSRKFIVNIDSIRKIHRYSNSRLKLNLDPSPPVDVLVSRDRVADFKEWLDR